MLDAVILDSDFPLTPTHVDTDVQIPKLDLRLGFWKPGGHQQQPHPCLLRRLRTAVGQLQRFPQPPNTASAPVPVGHSEDICGLDTCRIEQRVEDRYRLGHGQAATDIESSTGSGRHAHSRDCAHLFIGQLIAADENASLAVPVSAHDLCWRSRIEPFRAEYGGCRHAGQRRTRRQPRRARFGARRQLGVFWDVYVAEHRAVSRAQFTAGHDAMRERLTAEKWDFVHGGILSERPQYCVR